MSLPTLNINLYKTNPTKFANQLRHACHTIGFFLLRHDIAPATCSRALEETRQFFSRPMREKMTISYEHQPSFRGYMPLGVENTEGKTDRREQIEYAAEYYHHDTHHNNYFKAQTEEKYYHRLRATNPWPDEIQPTLRPAVMDYVSGVLDVAATLRDAMCLALNVDVTDVSPLFGNHHSKGENGQVHDKFDDEVPFWSMKLVSYPPANGDDFEQISTQGVGAHTDSNFLTLILQDPDHTGLQVQSYDGKWVDVPPTGHDTLVCNIGELGEIFSNGYFLATPHRVIRHYSPQSSYNQPDSSVGEPSAKNDCRTSLPIFYNPTLDTVMKPMVDLKHLPWERMRQNQWRREHNRMMGSVGENSFKSLARSHNEVFKRHHVDLKILEDGQILRK